jgi:hypothetical protein
MEDDLFFGEMEENLNLWLKEDNLIMTPSLPGDDAFPNLTESWLSSSKIYIPYVNIFLSLSNPSQSYKRVI